MSGMNRCVTCKHWSACAGFELPQGEGFGSCDMPGDGEGRPKPTDQAVTLGPNYEGGLLRTRPYFGCTEWKPKG